MCWCDAFVRTRIVPPHTAVINVSLPLGYWWPRVLETDERWVQVRFCNHKGTVEVTVWLTCCGGLPCATALFGAHNTRRDDYFNALLTAFFSHQLRSLPPAMPTSRAQVTEAYSVLGLDDVRQKFGQLEPSLTSQTQGTSLEVVKSTYKQVGAPFEFWSVAVFLSCMHLSLLSGRTQTRTLGTKQQLPSSRG